MNILKPKHTAVPTAQLEELLRQNKEYKDNEKKIVELITRSLKNIGILDAEGKENPLIKDGVTGKAIFKIVKENISITDLIMGNTSDLEKKFSFLSEIVPLYKQYKERNP